MKNISFILTSLIFLNQPYAALCGKDKLTIVVLAGAGGSGDTLARAITDKIREQTGTVLIVDNKPGAAGNTGAGVVKNLSTKDAAESTILFSQAPEMVVNPYIKDPVPTHKADDFIPMAYAAATPYALVCNREALEKIGVKDLAGLVAYIKKDKPLNYANGGIPNFTNLLMLQLGKAAQFKFGPNNAYGVPYKETSAGFTDVQGGKDVSCMFHSVSSVAGTLKTNDKLINLGTSAGHEVDAMGVNFKPISNTFSSFGEMLNWTGFYANKNASKEFVSCFNTAVKNALQSPDLQKKLKDLGFVPQPKELSSQEAFANHVTREGVRFKSGVVTDLQTLAKSETVLLPPPAARLAGSAAGAAGATP